MKTSRKTLGESSRGPTAAGLRPALAAWKPPANVKSSVSWNPRGQRREDGRSHHALVQLHHGEVTSESAEKVERSWSITVKVWASPGADPEVIIPRLDMVAMALQRGLAEARATADAQGFGFVSQEEHCSTSRRSPWDRRLSLSDPALAGMKFRRVPGWANYDVSATGVVRSYHDRENRTIAATPQRVLQPKGREGNVTLYRGRYGTDEHRSQVFAVADLVAMAWGDAAKGPAAAEDQSARRQAAKNLEAYFRENSKLRWDDR